MVRKPIQVSSCVPPDRDVSERFFTVYAVHKLHEIANAMDRYLGEITFNEEGNIAIAWAYPEEDRYDDRPAHS
jgi:hypothetical protein